MQKKKTRKKTKTKLKKKADKVFSDFIRQRDNGICFTCGNKKEWKYQQCGHFMSRSHTNTRYDEQNCHCQCVACNMFKGGNMPVYAIQLQKLYGNEILKELFKRANKIKKADNKFYEDIIKKYGTQETIQE